MLKVFKHSILTLLITATSFYSLQAQDDTSADLTSDELVIDQDVVGEEIPINTRVFIELRGGGEMVGRLAKRTPDALFLDIGPEILRLTQEQIRRVSTLDEARQNLLNNPELLGQIFDQESQNEFSGLPAFSRLEGGEELQSQTEILEDAKRSVVLISNPRGAGSGFILDEKGRVITNHHVIRNEKYHDVTIFQKSEEGQWVKHKFKQVEVEAFSWLYDIAILQLDLEAVEEEGVELLPLPVSEPRQLEVGDPVFAIGNPGGLGRMLEHTVSEGIVSSLTRNVNDVLYVQTTAAVNPGNSGGPLVNDRGEVVGLVTLKSSFQEGIGFALPSSLIWHFIHHSEAFAFGDQAPNKGIRYLTPP